MRTRGWLLASVTVALPLAAGAATTGVTADAPDVSEESAATAFVEGLSSSGTRGVFRVEAAFPLPHAGDIVVGASARYSYATDLFVAGDENTNSGQQLFLVWAPLAGLEIWLRQSLSANHNEAAAAADPSLGASVQVLGDPELGIKYSYPLTRRWGVGGGLALLMPTSAGGTGLAAGAVVLTGYAAASYLATPWLGLSVNAGYRYDNSDKIFAHAIAPVQRFVGNVNKVDAFLAGLGAQSYFELGDVLAIGPFAELSLAAGLGAALSASPMRLAAGTRLFPFGADSVELMLGGEVAFTGVPEPGVRTKMAGVPPWQIFAGLATHLGPRPPATAAAATCGADADCTDGGVCVEGVCGRVREVVREVPPASDPAVPVATFLIAGGVVDARSGEPLPGATVSFTGIDGSPLAVDGQSGAFKSWPIPVGEGMLKVVATAPGYRSDEQAMPLGVAGEVKQLAFKLQPSSEVGQGEILGSLKDGQTGEPIPQGQVFVPALRQTIAVDQDGKFSAAVRTGRYQLLISAKGYITQKKTIEIRAHDVIILNVDMVPNP